MKTNRIIGIAIIIIIIASICVVSYQSFTKTGSDNENYQENILKTSQLNTTDANNINLNIVKNTCDVDIEFADSDNVYTIISQDADYTVETNENSDTLNININSNDSDINLVLSNRYNYNITSEITLGGFDADIDDNVTVENMDIDITLGGASVTFDNGKINNLNIHITTGGAYIGGNVSGESHVNSIIEVGGIEIDIDSSITDIISKTKVVGSSINGELLDNEFKGDKFDTSPDKITINSDIKVGGLNIGVGV